MKFNNFVLCVVFFFISISAGSTQHLMCIHNPTGGGIISEDDCIEVYTSGKETFITFDFSLFLPKALFEDYELQVSTIGGGYVDERPYIIDAHNCSDGLQSLQYDNLKDCTEGIHDLVEYKSTRTFVVSNNICNGSKVFQADMCITPIPLNDNGGDIPNDLFYDCLLSDEYEPKNDGTICIPIEVNICCDDNEDNEDTGDNQDINRRSSQKQFFGNKIEKFKVSPNPANDQISISTQFENELIEVYNSGGQLQARFKLKFPGEHIIDISVLNPGVYILSKGLGVKNQVTRLVKI